MSGPADSAYLRGLEACLSARPAVAVGEGFAFRVPLIPHNAWTFDRAWLNEGDRRLQEFFSAHLPEFVPFPISMHDLSALFDAVAGLDGRWVADFAAARGIPLHVFALYCVYLIRPFRDAVPGELKSALAAHEPRATFCPLCGTPPTLVVEGGDGPGIWCVHCGGLRSYPPGLCPSCGKPVEPAQRCLGLKLLTCATCRRYAKVFPADAAARLDWWFVSTGAADEQALREGFVKEFPILPAAPLVGRR
jgi:hypothetical protein